MISHRFAVVGAVAVLSVLFAAPVALAADAPQKPVSIVLHIDSGFLGRPVHLQLFGGDVLISWDAGDVLAPGDLTVTRSSSTEISAEWSSSYLLASRGVTVGFRESSSIFRFDVPMIQTKKPFGAWQTQTTAVQHGYVTARMGAEGSVRLMMSPSGMRQGTATWYRYKGCDCAASPDFPKGTKLLIRLANHPEISDVVTVNDYGPDRNLFPNRVIDLDAVAFKKLAPLSLGLTQVTVEPVFKTRRISSRS